MCEKIFENFIVNNKLGIKGERKEEEREEGGEEDDVIITAVA